jgi:uncharacterized membrane protein HdeD (DUF308 family)
VRAFEVRHLQLARALFAALAAVMVTFSPDHSAAVGLSVFSGFAISSGLVFALAAWLVYPAGRRWPAATLALLTLVAGMVAGVAPWRTTEMLFVLMIAWAASTGVVEIVDGARARRAERAGAAAAAAPRDALTVGILGIALAIGVALVPTGYALDYYIDEARQSFTLTGTTIAVGIFGGYAAIVAVYLGIAGFSPRRDAVSTPASEEVGA